MYKLIDDIICLTIRAEYLLRRKNVIELNYLPLELLLCVGDARSFDLH